MSKKYFIALDEMTLDEIQVYKLLCKYSNYETNVAGYTIKQIVDSCDNRLNLTTQKVRTILKKFEKEGYIQFLTSGSKGRESTLKLTLKDMLFSQQQSNNNITNKSEELQGFEDSKQQQSNNNVTTLQKNKENNNNKEKENNLNEIIKAYTDNKDLKETIQDFIKMRRAIKKPLTDRALKTILNKLDKFADTDKGKILILEKSIENSWQTVYEIKEKAPVVAGAKKNYNYNLSICNNSNNNSNMIVHNDF